MSMLKCAFSDSISIRKFLSNQTLLLRLHSSSQGQPPLIHKAAVAADDSDAAVSSFNHMLHLPLPPPIIEFTKILGSLVTKGHYSSVIGLYKRLEFRGITPNIGTLNILLNCYCHVGEITLALSVMGKILKMGFRPNTIIINMLKGLLLNGELQKALEFHDKMDAQGFHLNEVTYGILINGLCKGGIPRTALNILRMIEGKSVVRPNLKMYSPIIGSFFKDGLVSDAYNLYSEILDKGISLDVMTCNIMINGFCLAGQLKEALGILSDMLFRSIRPNFVSFSMLMDALSKEANMEGAKIVLAVMTKEGMEPNVHTYNSLISGLLDMTNMVDEALNLFKEMQSKGMNPDIVTYSTLIVRLCMSGRMSSALELVEEMAKRGQPADITAYNWIMDILFKMQQDRKALILCNKILELGFQPDEGTFAIGLDRLDKAGRLAEARKFMENLVNQAYRADCITINILVRGLCQEGSIDQASAFLSIMENTGKKPSAENFELVIRAYAKKGENGKKSKLIDKLTSGALFKV